MSHEYTLIVHTSPADGREDEYNAWYDDVHLREFSALPGVINGRRFKVVEADADARPVYAAIYETSVDPAQVLAAMMEGAQNGTVHMSDALDMSSIKMTTLKPR
jgi:hypothetical protein